MLFVYLIFVLVGMGDPRPSPDTAQNVTTLISQKDSMSYKTMMNVSSSSSSSSNFFPGKDETSPKEGSSSIEMSPSGFEQPFRQKRTSSPDPLSQVKVRESPRKAHASTGLIKSELIFPDVPVSRRKGNPPEKNDKGKEVVPSIPEPGESGESGSHLLLRLDRDYTPAQIAEYIYTTGDEKGITQTVWEMLQDGQLMESRDDVIDFLESVNRKLQRLRGNQNRTGNQQKG